MCLDVDDVVAPGVSESKAAESVEHDRYLLLDSRIIEDTENVHLTVGTVQKDENNPLFKEDKPWEPRFDNPYCSVIFDEEEKIYKCWYSIFIKSGGEGDFPGEGLASDKRAWVEWTEGEEETLIYYDAADKKLKIDTRKSSLGEGSKKTEAGPLELGADEPLKLQVLVDKSVVEVFANERQAVMRRIYPTRADSLGVKLFSKGASATVQKLQVWEMMPSNAH